MCKKNWWIWKCSHGPSYVLCSDCAILWVLNFLLVWDGMGDKMKNSSEYNQVLAFRIQNMTILIKHRDHNIFISHFCKCNSTYYFCIKTHSRSLRIPGPKNLGFNLFRFLFREKSIAKTCLVRKPSVKTSEKMDTVLGWAQPTCICLRIWV